LYLGEEFRLIEAPVPLVDDEAFPTPAEEDGEMLHHPPMEQEPQSI
jgi:hypothetical protein